MSQEYTPTEWVDETSTTQGTLLNAARLNNLETAHHYCDGFEEVDEVPTEDPGTTYNKIVYCTADSAFYRWDVDAGEWTADIDDETRELLETEIARATEAEETLQDNIDAEETARTEADTALQTNIDTEAARAEAVEADLQEQIDTLSTTEAHKTEWSATMHVYTATSYTITHDLGDVPSGVMVYLQTDTGWNQIYVDTEATTSTITISFAAVPTYGSALKVKAVI